MQLNLTADSATLLEAVLAEYLSDLWREIAHTEAHDYREGLKKKEMALQRILEQLAR